ncbi:MAG TPA: CBS domain-containing protein [Nitrosopumilaceae archaeon]|nr:CBS domain-containing protein [Nitrosopumilaceae archaeon]
MAKLLAEKILDMSIQEAFPNIFDKGTVYVAPDTPIKNVALFLIPLRELYTSGIVVMKDNKPIGRIGPTHILKKVLEFGYPQCLSLTAKDVMVGIVREVRATFMLREVLEIFKNSKFGFTPVMKNELLAGSISTRDFLPFIAKMEVDRQASTIASDLIYISQGISVENTLRIMFKKDFRKIAIKENGEVKIIDDRSLLGYLFSWEKGKPNALDTDIDVLPKSNVANFPHTISISKAAEELLVNNLPCSISEDKIITPWDLVMKVMGQYVARTNMNETVLLD